MLIQVIDVICINNYELGMWLEVLWMR